MSSSCAKSESVSRWLARQHLASSSRGHIRFSKRQFVAKCAMPSCVTRATVSAVDAATISAIGCASGICNAPPSRSRMQPVGSTSSIGTSNLRLRKIEKAMS
eukprot:6173791-Pleurochrysis_carterae.AAC.2